MAEVNKKVQKESEKFEKYAEEDFGKILEAYEEGSDVYANKSIIEGTIVEIKDNEVFIDVKDKTEGILRLDEILDDNQNPIFKVEDKINVIVIGNNRGRPIVSYRKALSQIKIKEFIQNYNENNEYIFNVKITNSNKGGYICIDKDGLEFFMPKSLSALKEAKSLIGKTYKVKVIKVNPESQTIVVSRKKLIEDEKRIKKEAVDKVLQSNSAIEGTIRKITTYGMFVDVGGVDGLVHYSEISYKGPVNPSTLYKEGDSVLVKSIGYDEDKKHLSLSVKAAMPDPWNDIANDGLEIGDTIRVIVSNIEHYGAFVDLGNDIEGFLHISEISWDKNIKNPRDFIKEGQEIEVEVIEINPQERRLRVSLKNLLPKPFDEFSKKHKVGDVIRGTVNTITSFGAFIKLGDIDGLLHNEDCSWDRNGRCKDLFKQGDELEVKIIKIDLETQKISLSVKDLKDSPAVEFAKKHKVGDSVIGKIRDIKDFGVFVELEDGVDALIKKEDIEQSEFEKLNKGDDIEAAIDFIDEKRNKIRLSVKFLSKQKERAALNKINDDESVTLGDLIKEQLFDN